MRQRLLCSACAHTSVFTLLLEETNWDFTLNEPLKWKAQLRDAVGLICSGNKRANGRAVLWGCPAGTLANVC